MTSVSALPPETAGGTLGRADAGVANAAGVLVYRVAGFGPPTPAAASNACRPCGRLATHTLVVTSKKAMASAISPTA